MATKSSIYRIYNIRFYVIIIALSWLSLVWAETSSKVLVIAGAGTSTEITTILAEQYGQIHPEQKIKVPPLSIKHAGGLQWVTEKGNLLGRLGRPISKEDLEQYPDVRSLPIAQVKIAFATQRQLGITQLTHEQFKQIYLGQINNWSELGGPDQVIIRFGREETESALQEITQKYPFMKQALFFKQLRKDHEMIDLLCQVPGSIGFAELSNLDHHKELQILNIEGFDCGLEVGLVYHVSQSEHPIIKSIKEYVLTPSWRQILIDSPYYSPPTRRPTQ